MLPARKLYFTWLNIKAREYIQKRTILLKYSTSHFHQPKQGHELVNPSSNSMQLCMNSFHFCKNAKASMLHSKWAYRAYSQYKMKPLFPNTHKAIFSMEQVYDTQPISLYTSLHNELHPFSLSISTEQEDKLDRSMELVNCNKWSKLYKFLTLFFIIKKFNIYNFISV